MQGHSRMQAFDHLPIYDSGTAPEIVAYGIAKIEIIGPMTRFFMHVPQDVGGIRSRSIVAIITVPTETIPANVVMTEMALASRNGIKLAS